MQPVLTYAAGEEMAILAGWLLGKTETMAYHFWLSGCNLVFRRRNTMKKAGYREEVPGRSLLSERKAIFLCH